MSTTGGSVAVFQPDVIVVGGGLIGLCCATALAREGARVMIVSSREDGAASPAAAGILAPSVGVTPDQARALGIAARDMYPEFVHGLAERTGVHVALDRGVVEIAFTDEDGEALRSVAGADSVWLDAKALHHLEPALSRAAGGVLHPQDGSVDAAALVSAVRNEAMCDNRVSLQDGRVVRLRVGGSAIGVHLESGDRVDTGNVVVAAGAWVSAIAGLPRPLPVEPVRGQMVAVTSAPIRHVVMGPRGYVVPLADCLLVGSTTERVGFDAGTTDTAAALLRESATEIAPALAASRVLAHWSGLRPMTPDLLPIVGAEPSHKGLFYACGHSRNGILLAPLTGMVIAELVTRGSASVDLGPYAPSRFGR